MFACENCSQVFDNGKLLLDHRVREYCSTTCWRCTRAFNHRQELSSHQQNVTNINCKICEDKFCNKKDYQEHQIYIHGEDPQLRSLLIESSWAIMDIEYIQTSRSHQCIRKLYILAKNGNEKLESEFYPCTRYTELRTKYRKSFDFCKKNIHRLTYNPKNQSLPCSKALEEINNFIVNNGIDMIIYKGGNIERDTCIELCIPSRNIESFQGLKKANSHDPSFEVNFYYDQIINLIS